MALPAYMSVTGKQQGHITAGASKKESTGKTGQKGHDDEVLVQAVSHEVIRASDPQTGQPTSDRIHRPFIVTKAFDKSSPLLQVALCSNERLTKVEIKWYRNGDNGVEHYYTTTLEDAVIVSIKDYMHNCQDSANGQFTHLEDVHFSYRKITWDHLAAKTSGYDDWETPTVS